MSTQIDHNDGTVRQDDRGHEIPDPNPIEVPLGHKVPETLAQMFQRYVRVQFSEYAAQQGTETFDQADDFDHPEDLDPTTPYEVEFDPVLGKELTAADFMDPNRREWLKEQYLLAERNSIRAAERKEAIDQAYKDALKNAVQGRAAPAKGRHTPTPAEQLKAGPTGPDSAT